MVVERVTQLPPAPDRPDESHKGTYGRVLVIAGGRGMSGAACLSGLGALRGGAGLVYLAVPEGILNIVAAVEPSYLTLPLPEDGEGRISLSAKYVLEAKLGPMNTVAFGPGCGQSKELCELTRWLYTSVELPMVVDADGLNALAAMPEVLSQSPQLEGQSHSRVLTPHPGEFARLSGVKNIESPSAREQAAAKFAAEHGVVLLLKGRGTIITDGQRLAVNTTGNSGMATGGTGDVLTGSISALLAQGMAPFEAAWFGAHLHGLAGDVAAERLSKPGLIASDVAYSLAKAWQRVAT